MTGRRAGVAGCAHGAAPVAIFGPDPLLSLAVEARADGSDEIHVHAAGAYVWFAARPGTTTYSHTSGGDSQNAGVVWRPITHPGYDTLVQVVMQPD